MANRKRKTRELDNPYEIWVSWGVPRSEVRVLKQYDDDATRFHVAFKGEGTYGGWEYKDMTSLEMASGRYRMRLNSMSYHIERERKEEQEAVGRIY